MTLIDWLAIVFVVLLALLGIFRGFLAGALSAVGVVGGAILGARLAPHVLDEGSSSPYTPLVGLAGAAVLALIGQSIGYWVGSAVRVRLSGRARAFDSAAGFLFGAAAAVALVWVAGAVALQFPGQTRLRREAQRSLVLRQLNDVVPPRRALRALGRIDPFRVIGGPPARVGPPDPRVLRRPAVRLASASVVRVVGTACGLGVAGSGWAAGPDLVVTNAHVVAGQDDTAVQRRSSDTRLDAEVVAFDDENDLAVLRVDGLAARELTLADPKPGEPVAIVGFPENGPFDAEPGRTGRTVAVFTEDAYGKGPIRRTITSVRGLVRRGNSGGPTLNGRGEVTTTVFAARHGNREGYGVPADVVRRVLARAGEPVDTGDCVR